MKTQIVIGSTILLMSGIALHFFSPKTNIQIPNSENTITKSSPFTLADSYNKDSSYEFKDIKEELLSNEKTLAYLKKEEEKKRLQHYFENPTGENPQAIFELIEKIEQEGRVVGFEALSLKLAWLELNTTDEQDFQTKSEHIIEEYRKKAADSKAAHQPSSIPGFDEYKEREQAIIQEINSMHEFPDDHTKQSYLRFRLQQAREVAYQ